VQMRCPSLSSGQVRKRLNPLFVDDIARANFPVAEVTMLSHAVTKSAPNGSKHDVFDLT
jgi:hypothetical protein